MKQNRNPLANKFRMAWLLVFFDLPVGSKQERKAATNFREDLLKEGYMMIQFSVYARPCVSQEKVRTQLRRLLPKIPCSGQVRALTITDAQWARMKFVQSDEHIEPENLPTQLTFF